MAGSKKKIAVILLNLGGPDNLQNVKPFLFNLFNDRAIINLPMPLRWMVAKLISWRREKTAQEIYSLMGGKSTILEQTKAQAGALEAELAKSDLVKTHIFKPFICMRYWHPRASELAGQIDDFAPDEVILLPLYPQFSTTTTGSSVSEIKNLLNPKYKIKTICCYYDEENFINSHMQLIKQEIKKFKDKNFHILFSAHGLPKSIIKSGDPYQWQVENTVALIAGKLNLSPEQYKICYQSRVGPMEWLKPDTEEEIKKLAAANIPMILVPIAFVSEHSETLVELDIEYKEIADATNTKFVRVPALSVEKNFIKSLAKTTLELAASSRTRIFSPKKTCPANFKRALCKCSSP